MLVWLTRAASVCAALLVTGCRSWDTGQFAGQGLTLAKVEAIIEQHRGAVPWRIEKTSNGVVVIQADWSPVEMDARIALWGKDGALENWFVVFTFYMPHQELRLVPDGGKAGQERPTLTEEEAAAHRNEVATKRTEFAESYKNIVGAIWREMFPASNFERWRKRTVRKWGTVYEERFGTGQVRYVATPHIDFFHVTLDPACYGGLVVEQEKPPGEVPEACIRGMSPN